MFLTREKYRLKTYTKFVHSFLVCYLNTNSVLYEAFYRRGKFEQCFNTIHCGIYHFFFLELIYISSK